MAQRTSYRFVDVAKAYSDKLATVANLDATALYELAAPSTPPEIRDRVEEMLVDGEKVTAAQIKRMKAEMRAAQDAASRLRGRAQQASK